ncbi:MAG: glycosyltransferase family 39 protein [Isosphaeraceae bacterium]
MIRAAETSPTLDHSDREARRPCVGPAGVLTLILVAAGVLRAWDLGSLSFWYDEVVTMSLAETPGPADLIDQLGKIDATRAPLHPLLLQGWIRLFGPSEASARSLSVLCGVAAVYIVSRIGEATFDRSTGLWAAWLAAISPLLVYYSREARMYALLVLLTCLCWALLSAPSPLSGRGGKARLCVYTLGLTALLYTHPLGLLMAGALFLATALGPRRLFGTRGRWVGVHVAAILLAAPWLPRYIDHAPEFLTGRLPVKFLLGTPIGFLGGNGLVLAGLVGLAALGLLRRVAVGRRPEPSALAGLLIWLAVPPSLLYAYSLVGSPIFGPARYTLFVAPAYLILVAQGLARLPRPLQCAAGLLILVLAGQSLRTTVYATGLKADWRSFGRALASRLERDPSAAFTVLVRSADPARNVEVETARYYLPPACRILPAGTNPDDALNEPLQGEPYLAVGIKGPAASPPEPRLGRWGLDQQYPGLAVYRPIDR